MVFSSLLFLACFLPLFLIIYIRVRGIEQKNRVLLIFSLIFYAFSGLRYLVLLLLTVLVAFATGQQIYLHKRSRKAARHSLIVGVVILAGVLVFFKYTGFFLGSLGAVFRQDWNILSFTLPLGISFYTFRLISYLADIYKGEIVPEENYLSLLLFTSLFQSTVSGPIVRYKTIGAELHDRKSTWLNISIGLNRFALGLFKKAVLADHCGELANTLAPMSDSIHTAPALAVWLGMLFYMLQIYLDFASYSDMAIGLARMCGFHFDENFNYPYIAANVRDFWNRWHISLSTFFRDYIYFPLGGSRCSTRRMLLNLLAVWALTGLWHGASWNFILWGLYYYVFVVWEHMNKVRGKKELPPVIGHLRTLFIVYIGWIFFRFSDFGQLGGALKGLFGGGGSFTSTLIGITLKNNLFFLIAALLMCTPFFAKLQKLVEHRLINGNPSGSAVYILRVTVALAAMIIAILAMVGNSFQPFLYKQF